MTRFISENETVTDTKTGLMWPKNPSIFEFPLNWEEALESIKEININSLYGYNDWKLPNRKELLSLISHENINPCLPEKSPFEGVFNGYYWTSTTCARLWDQAWHIHFGGARVVKGLKQYSYMIWPVRATENFEKSLFGTGQKRCFDKKGNLIKCNGTGQDGEFISGASLSGKRFEPEGEIVTDKLTGLTWLKNANPFEKMISWETAFNNIERMNAENAYGFDDWRIPEIPELESLTDLDNHSPALPPDHPFKNVQDFYWSSTTSAYETSYAWALYLRDGLIGVGHKPLSEFYLWPVRGKENIT